MFFYECNNSKLRPCYLFSVFNVGEYRRKRTREYNTHEFFRMDNQDAMQVREECALACIKDACNWISNEGGEVAVS